MAIDPTPPNWGTVIGRFTSVWGDGNDAGDAPDLVAMSGGVTLTPTVAWVRLTDGTSPVTVVTRPVVCTLDSDGVMIGPDGLPGVRVMASDAPGVTPTGIQYRVSFQLKGKTGWPLDRQPDSFLITIPGGTTTDLSDVVPASTVTPVLTIVSRADRELAQSAAATAQQAATDAIAAAASIGTGGGGGTAGASAYQLAVQGGYSGTQAQWLASLDGADGVTPVLAIGTVTTLAPTAPATATLTGTTTAPVLNLGIPQGAGIGAIDVAAVVMSGATGQAVMAQVFTLLSAQFAGTGRLRLYSSAAARTADTERAIGATYTGTGLLYEYLAATPEYDAYQAFTLETAPDKTVHWAIDGGLTATIRYLPGA